MKKQDVNLNNDLVNSLPILCPTMRELVVLSQKEEIDLNKLKDLLFWDVGLCVKALKEINSIENRSKPIESLQQGLESLELEHFLFKALSSHLNKINSEDGVWYNRFNQHSVVTAMTCKMIGEELKYEDLEELYLCGLLHDIGILFLRNNFPEEYALVLERENNGEALARIEREILSTDHMETAEREIKDWSFPHNLKVALGEFKFEPDKEMHSNKQLTNVVGVAGKFSEVLFVETEKSEINKLFNLWEESLNLPSGFFEKLYPQLQDEVNRRSAFCQNISEDQTEIILEAHKMVNKFYQSCENKIKEKFRELAMENEVERKKAELESLRIVLATFSHYINNATTSIMGRSQLIDIAVRKGEIKDESGKISSAMKIIQRGVENITAVLNGLKKLDSFRTVRYHERSNIIDLADKIDIKNL